MEIQEYSSEQLIQMAQELEMVFIPEDATIRQYAAEIYQIDVDEVSLLQMVSLAGNLAGELARRLQETI